MMFGSTQAGIYVTSQSTLSFWPIKRLNLLFIAGNVLRNMLSRICLSNRFHFKCSVDTLIDKVPVLVLEYYSG